MIDAHVRPVHQFHHCGVDAIGADSQLLPQRLAFFRSQVQGGIGLLRPGKLGHEEVRQIAGNRHIVTAFGCDLEEARRDVQALRILDLIVAAFALRHQLQRAHQHAAVIGVRGCTGGNFTQQIARGNGVRIGSADAQLGPGRDAAGSHVAQAAANAVGAELALWML